MKFGLTEEIYNSLKRIIENYQQYDFKIFGSRARGNYKKTSDIDIAIFKNVKRKMNIVLEMKLINLILYTK